MNNKVEVIAGCNIPEFHEALSSAAGNALGYFWCPIVIWRDRNKKTRFVGSKKEDGKPKWEGDWEKVITLIPHVYER